MKLIKNSKIDRWKQFNNGIIDNQEKAIVMDTYPKNSPYRSYGRSCDLCWIVEATSIKLIEHRVA